MEETRRERGRERESGGAFAAEGLQTPLMPRGRREREREQPFWLKSFTLVGTRLSTGGPGQGLESFAVTFGQDPL